MLSAEINANEKNENQMKSSDKLKEKRGGMWKKKKIGVVFFLNYDFCLKYKGWLRKKKGLVGGE